MSSNIAETTVNRIPGKFVNKTRNSSHQKDLIHKLRFFHSNINSRVFIEQPNSIQIMNGYECNGTYIFMR